MSARQRGVLALLSSALNSFPVSGAKACECARTREYSCCVLSDCRGRLLKNNCLGETILVFLQRAFWLLRNSWHKWKLTGTHGTISALFLFSHYLVDEGTQVTGNERERTNETMAARWPLDMGPEIVWMGFSTTPHKDTFFVSLLGLLELQKQKNKWKIPWK